MTVRYRGKTYRVVYTAFLGRSDLYALASNHAHGSMFPALKSDCRVVR